MNGRLFKKTLCLACLGCLLLPTVSRAQWVDFARLSTNRFGSCRGTINLRTLLTPHTEDGTAHVGGIWYVDGTALGGETWSVPADLEAERCFEVSYRWQVTADSVGSNQMQLCIAPPPTLDVSLPSDVCPDSTAELKVRFVGDAPFTMAYEFLRHTLGHNPVVSSETRVVPTDFYTESIYSLLGEDSVSYRFIALTDAHGCPSLKKMGSHSLAFIPEQRFDVFTRHPHYPGVEWTKTTGYTINRGDSIGVQVAPKPGFPVANYRMTINGDESAVGGTPFTLCGSGIYRMEITGGECPVVQHTTIQIDDTPLRYIRLKVFLEGPYNDASGLMRWGAITIPAGGAGVPPGLQAVDWLTVEVRRAPDAEQAAAGAESCRVVAADSCLLLSDGSVVTRVGSSIIDLQVENTPSDDIHTYLVVRHRNHLPLMSNEISDGEQTLLAVPLVDLTKSKNLYYPADILSGYALFPRVDGNHVVAMSVGYFDRSLVSVSSANEVAKGMTSVADYSLYDVNMDGRVDWQDGGTDWGLVYAARDRYPTVRNKIVDPLPEFTPDAGAISVQEVIWCQGVTVQVVSLRRAQLDGAVNYSWYKNDTLMEGFHDIELSISNLDVGVYTLFRRATSADGTLTLDTEKVQISIIGTPVIPALTDPGLLCAGDEINPEAPEIDNNGSAIIAQGWMLGGDIIEMPYTLSRTDNGRRLCYWAKNGCGEASLVK